MQLFTSILNENVRLKTEDPSRIFSKHLTHLPLAWLRELCSMLRVRVDNMPLSTPCFTVSSVEFNMLQDAAHFGSLPCYFLECHLLPPPQHSPGAQSCWWRVRPNQVPPTVQKVKICWESWVNKRKKISKKLLTCYLKCKNNMYLWADNKDLLNT